MMLREIIIVVAFMCSMTMAWATPTVGELAPDFTIVDSYGAMHTLSDYRGQRVILEWTNHDCPYVRKHYGSGNMQSLQQEATEDGTIWLSIISSAPGRQGYVSADEANTLTASRGAYPTAVLFDPEGTVGRSYDARTTPHMYIIDTDGVLRYMGAIDDRPTTRRASIEGADNYVRTALGEMDSGSDIVLTETTAYGCSIKYR